MNIDDLQHRFKFHATSRERNAADHEGVREGCLRLALLLNDLLPDGREKALAITHLEDVMMWGNAAIARRHEF